MQHEWMKRHARDGTAGVVTADSALHQVLNAIPDVYLSLLSLSVGLPPLHVSGDKETPPDSAHALSESCHSVVLTGGGVDSRVSRNFMIVM